MLALLLACATNGIYADSGASVPIVRQVDIITCEDGEINYSTEPGEELPTVVACGGDTCQASADGVRIWEIEDIADPLMTGTAIIYCNEGYVYRIARMWPLIEE